MSSHSNGKRWYERILENLPNWVWGGVIFAVACIVLIQMIRGQPLMCADGTILPKSCAPRAELEGAVVAFDLPTKCPDGWDAFTLGHGRFIVGAGPANGPSKVDQNGELLKDHAYRSHEGRQELLVNGLPQHEHRVVARTAKERKLFATEWGHTVHEAFGKLKVGKASSPHVNRIDVDDGSPFDNKRGDLIATKVDSKPYSQNNMPPFVALYFCKKS